MHQTALLRGAAGRASTSVAACNKPVDTSRPAIDVSRSRRNVLLGFGAGLAGLMSSASGARAARPTLVDLVLPLVQPLDSNGDGLLDVDEVRGALQRRVGMTLPRERVIRDVMAPVDFNDDADLSVDEFARGMALELEVDERWMRVMESDGESGLSQSELAAGLGDLGQAGREVLPVAFKMADVDRDGRLSQSEAGYAMRLIAQGVLGDYYDEEAGL